MPGEESSQFWNQHQSDPSGMHTQQQQNYAQFPQQYPRNQQSEMMPTNSVASFKTIVNEMKAKQFDNIRFAAYRTASKLRYIQHRTHFNLVDIWNVIEAFRQSGLHTMESGAQLDQGRVEETVRLIITGLNMRLPANRQVQLAETISLVVSWLLHSYDTSGQGQVRLMAIKVALSTLAAGKPIDKFKYHFTLISDPSGALMPPRFEQYLHDLLVLAVGVFEGPNFAYDATASKFMFTVRARNIVIEEFLNRMLTDPGPQCLLWLTIFHRMVHVQNVRHSVRCEVCKREGIMGFRYKCQRCHNYNLCQECFWTGACSGNHTNQHDVKEYTSSKSHARQLGHTLRKSFGKSSNSRNNLTSLDGYQSAGAKPNCNSPRRPPMEAHLGIPGRTFDMNHVSASPSTPRIMTYNPHQTGGILPSSSQPSIQAVVSSEQIRASPSPSVSMGINNTAANGGQVTTPNQGRRRPNSFNFDPNKIDDEHRLIARYAARLAADVNEQTFKSDMPLDLSAGLPIDSTKRELIIKLEAKNRDILKEIQRLRVEQAAAAACGMASPSSAAGNPSLLVELRALRYRKDELEHRMTNLQESRKELMQQLGSLMHLLKEECPTDQSRSGIHSTSGPGGSLGALPTMGGSTGHIAERGNLAPRPPPRNLPRVSTGSLDGGLQSSYLLPGPYSFSQSTDQEPQGQTALRQDLLQAADSVTHAMSSLVRQLNSSDITSTDTHTPPISRGIAVVAAPSSTATTNNNGVTGREYEMEYERALEMNAQSKSKDHQSGANNRLDGGDMSGGPNEMGGINQRMLTEQRFLTELQARRTPGNHSGMTSSMGAPPMTNNHLRTSSFTSQDSDADNYLYSDPECGGGGNTDAEGSAGQDHRFNNQRNQQAPYRRYATDEETDQESCIRTDEEDGGNTDWEDNMRRWVNR